jgi:alpha-ribazole phosphatase
MINLYLLRHGKTLGKPALNGHTDVGVKESVQKSIAQALLNNYDFQTVYTSPLIRCKRVAELLAEYNPSLDIRYDNRLREQSFGQLDGIPFDELNDEWATLEAFWSAPGETTLPEAEPLEEGYRRVIEAWEQLVEECQQDTVIIAHGGPIRYILAHVLGLDWKNPRWYTSLAIGNQSISHIQINRYQGKPYFSVCSIATSLTDTSGN